MAEMDKGQVPAWLAGNSWAKLASLKPIFLKTQREIRQSLYLNIIYIEFYKAYKLYLF